MKKFSVYLALFTLLSFGAFGEEPMKITVDGQSVSTDIPPVIVNNQILVPLRAITERLGATIIYDPLSHTITASRANTTVDLAVKSNLAFVNGESRYLEIAPTIVNGHVMVPLRFLIESLGVELKRTADARTIALLSRTGGAETPASIGTPKIEQVLNMASGLLGTGDRLTVEMIGDPGGTASFDISGVTRGIPMIERSPGHYRGTFVIPPGLEARQATIVAHLSVNGQDSVAAASGTIDILGRLQTEPEIQVRPQPDTVIRSAKPFVSAYFTEQIIPKTVHVIVDDLDMTPLAEIDDHSAQWLPKTDLVAGEHRVTISGETRQGSTFTKTWSFYLTP